MTDRNSQECGGRTGRISSELSWGSVVIKRLVVSSEELITMLLILLLLSLARLVTSVQEMTLAGIFDEGDTQYAEVFRQAVEDVNNNRYSIQ